MELREQMLAICKSAGFEPTENFDKIVKAKERFGIGLGCPCDRNSDRACISERCAREIMQNGICHCRCYRLPEKKETEE